MREGAGVMAMSIASEGAASAPRPALSYQRTAAALSLLAGAAGLLYSVSFIILDDSTLSGLFLLLGGVLSTAVLLALHDYLRAIDAGFARCAVTLLLVGAAGAAVHGGYDLANGINPPDGGVPDLPSQIDPRGLLTFGVTGLGLLLSGWLLTRGTELPPRLGVVAAVLGALLVVLYVGRLTVLNAHNPLIVIPALLTGFLLNPTWYIWLGLALRRIGR
jgi:hypothetical protein